MTSSFSINAKPDGLARIFVDGDDVTPVVRNYTLEGGVDGPTTLVLQLAPGKAVVTGDGKVLQLTDGAPAAAFVANLDPDALEKEINGRMTQTGETVGQAIVEVLAEAVEQLNEQLAANDE